MCVGGPKAQFTINILLSPNLSPFFFDCANTTPQFRTLTHPDLLYSASPVCLTPGVVKAEQDVAGARSTGGFGHSMNTLRQTSPALLT